MPNKCCVPAKCVRCGERVPWFSLLGNFTLTLYKVFVGYLGGSKALIADGLHSFTDVIGTCVILISCKISKRPADLSHPYGHGKVEFLSSAFIYLVLILVAVGLFAGGLAVIMSHQLHPPNIVTLLGGIISWFYNVIMYNLGQCAGKKNNSPALLANSFENRADAISSVAVSIGIALAMTVHPICDPLAAMAVGVIILFNCIIELKKSLTGLMDKALPPEIIQGIRQVALNFRGITGVTFVKSRAVGTGFWVDLGLQVSPKISVARGESIAAEVRAELMRRTAHLHTVEVFLSPEGSR